MGTGTLGHTHEQLHVLSIQDPKKAQDNTRAIRIIIHTNIYIYHIWQEITKIVYSCYISIDTMVPTT